MNRSTVTADEALQRLIDGNERFRRGEGRPFVLQKDVLADLALGQHPYAAILGCSDSRVPPESIFDAGLGELFVMRVAGNVLSPEIAGSLQYAGAHLNIPLVVVLGHAGCGAVQAALETKYQNTRQHSRIQILVESLLPALPDFDPSLTPKELLARAVESNVRWTLHQIVTSPEGKVRMAEGKIKFAGAIYDIESGRVKFLT